MAKLKGSHASKKAQATAYQALNKAAVNKTRKLKKHLKKHPNDVQGATALSKGVGRTRKNPTNKNGWVQDGVRNFISNYSLQFAFQTINYKDLVTIGSENFKCIAQVIKQSKKMAKAPPLYKKGVLHPFYTNKFLGLN